MGKIPILNTVCYFFYIHSTEGREKKKKKMEHQWKMKPKTSQERPEAVPPIRISMGPFVIEKLWLLRFGFWCFNILSCLIFDPFVLCLMHSNQKFDRAARCDRRLFGTKMEILRQKLDCSLEIFVELFDVFGTLLKNYVKLFDTFLIFFSTYFVKFREIFWYFRKFCILNGCIVTFFDPCFLNFPRFIKKTCPHASAVSWKTSMFLRIGYWTKMYCAYLTSAYPSEMLSNRITQVKVVTSEKSSTFVL